ncbi:MAG: helix-turn-helix domain-containing protein [Nonlabens sp.]
MNQPDLGILIADLRKKQGLTQEELVERCNINVRTIQRIEAGEVNPRSYTIKNILEALGTSIDDVFQEQKSSRVNESTQIDVNEIISNEAGNSWYLSGAISGIFYLLLSTVIVVLSLNHQFGGDKLLSTLTYIILNISSFACLSWFYFNLYKLGSARISNLFAYSCLIMILVNLLTSIWDVNIYASDMIDNSWDELVVAIPSMFVYGLTFVFLGIGLFTERKRMGDTIKWTGIFGIIGGFGFATVILFPVGIIATLIFETLLVVLLFQNGNKKTFLS